MKQLVVLLMLVLSLGAYVGCGKEDPTKRPEYKDMTAPANMPKMGTKPGAP
jgi:hypothetical protein